MYTKILATISVILIAFVVLLGIYFSVHNPDSPDGSAISAEKVADELINSTVIKFEPLVKVAGSNIDAHFSFDRKSIEEIAYYISKSDNFAEEICIIKVGEASAIPAVREAFSNHLRMLEASFKDSNPKEYAKIKDVVIFEKGSVICLVISPNSTEALKILNRNI